MSWLHPHNNNKKREVKKVRRSSLLAGKKYHRHGRRLFEIDGDDLVEVILDAGYLLDTLVDSGPLPEEYGCDSSTGEGCDTSVTDNTASCGYEAPSGPAFDSGPSVCDSVSSSGDSGSFGGSD